MSIKETCNKCGNEVVGDRKLDDKVWNCPNCGLEEYQSASSSTEETNKKSNELDSINAIKQEEGRPKYYLNEVPVSSDNSNSITKKIEKLKSALDLAPEPTITGMFHYAGKNKLFMTIDNDCKLCCDVRFEKISFEVDFSNEIEKVFEYRKERDVIEHLSELMIERFVEETNRKVIEFVKFLANDSIVRAALLSYVNKGLVSFDITEAITEIEVSDEGLISFSPSDKPTDANEASKYMTKEEIEKHNADIDEILKSMKDDLDKLF